MSKVNKDDFPNLTNPCYCKDYLSEIIDKQSDALKQKQYYYSKINNQIDKDLYIINEIELTILNSNHQRRMKYSQNMISLH